jgi:hypothetical protein
MAACTPSIHLFHGRPLFILSSGIHSIISCGILSSGILLTLYRSLILNKTEWKVHQVCITILMQLKGVVKYIKTQAGLGIRAAITF